MLSTIILSLLSALLTLTNAVNEPQFTLDTTGIGYGRPTAACDGMGVCIVTNAFTDMIGQENFGVGELTFGRKGVVSKIRIPASTMTKATISKHFSGDYFLMPEPFEGELSMGKRGLKISIPDGKHRLKMSKGDYIIMIGE